MPPVALPAAPVPGGEQPPRLTPRAVGPLGVACALELPASDDEAPGSPLPPVQAPSLAATPPAAAAADARYPLPSRASRGRAPERYDPCAMAAMTAFMPNPRSIEEALQRPDAAEWQRAVEEEIAACLEYGVWSECELPPGKQALPTHFVLERKRDGRYKARLVAGGHKQQYGLDYYATFAPVCSHRTLRIMLAVCAHEGLEMRQFDIRTAFLNGELEEEVYVRPPAGVPHLASLGHVLRLLRALYGLRQASRAWHRKLEAELRARGFAPSDADPALWMLYGEGGVTLAMFYVDDGLVAARTAAEAEALVAIVASMFAIRELGEPSDFLGIRITRDRVARTITIDQEDKARALALEFGVTGRRSVPMTPDVHGALRGAEPGEPMAQRVRYQVAVGSLLHLAQCTRPDIAQAVGALASYSAAPSQAHYAAVLDVIRYVGCTPTRGITYGRDAVPVRIWCDASFSACRDTRRSTTGWLVTMYGGAVSWSSKRQATVAVSTMEAEYQACGAAAREALSLRKALKEFAPLSGGLQFPGPLCIRCDNRAALTLCSDRKEGQRTKHIDVIHHFARERVASGEVAFEFCRSVDNASDCFTKALAPGLFQPCLRAMGMLGPVTV